MIIADNNLFEDNADRQMKQKGRIAIANQALETLASLLINIREYDGT